LLKFDQQRKLLIIIVSASSLFFLFQVTKLRIDNSLQVWFTEDDPALINYHSFLNKFGNDEVVTLLVRDSLPFYDSLRLQKTIALHHELEGIEGVASVRSIANAYLSHTVNQITAEKLFTRGITKERLAYIKSKIEGSEINSRFVDRLHHSTVFYVWMDTLTNIDSQRKSILDRIKHYSRESLVSKNGSIHLGGVGVLFEALNSTTIKEGTLLIVLSYLLLTVSIFLATRSVFITASTVIVVSLSSMTMFGFMGMLNRSINMISLTLPPLIMVMGVSNMIHITNHLRYSYKTENRGNFTPIRELPSIIEPILFNALTTAAGFFSLTIGSMAISRDYGLFAGIGILSVFVYSVIVALFLDHRFLQSREQEPNLFNLSRATENIFQFAIDRRNWIFIFCILIAAGSIVGINKINIDTYSLDFLPANHLVRQDDKIIEENIGSYIPLEFVITLKNNSWKNVDIMADLQLLRDVLKKENDIHGCFSIANIVSEINQGASLTQNKLVLIATQLEKEASFNQIIGDRGKSIRMTINVSMASAKEFKSIADKVVTISKRILKPQDQIIGSGYLPLYSSIIDKTLKDQVSSFSLAFFIIVILILFLFRSLKFALLSLPSNILPILFVLGYMGFTGMRLDIATITVAATVFGIIVDDSIHILFNLKRSLHKELPVAGALRLVAHKTGKSVISTSLILAAGYSIVAFGTVKLISNSGLLMIITICFALITDLLLIPALASFFFKDNERS